MIKLSNRDVSGGLYNLVVRLQGRLLLLKARRRMELSRWCHWSWVQLHVCSDAVWLFETIVHVSTFVFVCFDCLLDRTVVSFQGSRQIVSWSFRARVAWRTSLVGSWARLVKPTQYGRRKWWCMIARWRHRQFQGYVYQALSLALFSGHHLWYGQSTAGKCASSGCPCCCSNWKWVKRDALGYNLISFRYANSRCVAGSNYSVSNR